MTTDVSSDAKLAAVKSELAEFIKHNPHAEVSAVEGSESLFTVDRPWGDEGVRVHLGEDRAGVIAALNKVMLPPPFSALWHHEDGKLEVIWTAFQLGEEQQEIAGRTFSFDQGGLTLTCTFGDASDELKTISRYCFPHKLGNPPNFRNLQSFNAWASAQGDEKDQTATPRNLDKPRSFWISGLPLEFNEQVAIDIVRNINFFLRYYDHRSPTVLIHADDNLDPSVHPVRYIEGKFPEKIQSGDLDETLLGFWSAASMGGNEILRFMLFWRVIEYAAFHYMAEKGKLAIRKILSSPSRAADLDGTIAKIAAAVSSANMDDVPKFNELMRAAVDPNILWMEIEANKSSFSSAFTMDGGYELAPLVGVNETSDTFCTGGMVKVCVALRKIRNCLSHGQDQGSAGVILPTTRNLRRLRPWVHLIGKAAGEVVLYRDLT